MTSTSTEAGQKPGPIRRLRALSLLWIGLGAFIGLAGLGAITASSGQPLLIGSFGASGVLLFAYPEGPFSQVRNVIGGHFLTSLVALTCLQVFGPGLLPMAFAGALATVLMVVTRTVHPPAGGNPVIVFMTQPGWSFLLLPTLGGACWLMLTAWLYWKGIRWLQQYLGARV
ncbi:MULTISPECIES: HPP family protein [Pseudomonas]|jgi:CBS-domain-containing membrane protein|uniref:HPP family protein n=1 Tax=Pseudomonas gingeri TaxID=117681 RepID=A0A7Y7WE55_9PSED|nr:MULTISPECIES: HPP family protein [Pseudomonas]MCU1736206.1 HPP family protein [Pseudomonas sp. 20S_6.2_Bac1]NWB47747.1 HPP family protein [Pseudomonas gingeri]